MDERKELQPKSKYPSTGFRNKLLEEVQVTYLE